MKPIVDGLEEEYKNDLVVIRVNVQDPAGKELGKRYNFRFTPTFIFFDREGKEAWRSIGNLEEAQLRESLP